MEGEAVDAATLRRWLDVLAARLSERADYLTQLDAAIGDGDHGINMDRGFRAVRERVLDPGNEAPLDGLLKGVGMTLLSTVGGAAGPLYGTFFLRMAAQAGAKDRLPAPELAAALAAGVEGVRQRGRAEPGDKTMLDALLPGVETLERMLAEGRDLASALEAAAAAAEEGCRATVPMVARKGRASYLGQRSAGHQDPGATSSAYLLRALAAAVSGS
ncbi:MAG TPA: dihydroxyacetone kinase subunit DhaL [Candidatus Dormibacteraeota bacterium]|nr:dihydroxyacetone kinase subunit DhaL [Candidatus Dormibacteraeota bacterium]